MPSRPSIAVILLCFPATFGMTAGLAIIFALSTKENAAAWWSEVRIIGVSVGSFILIGSILAIYLSRALRRREPAEPGLCESDLKLRLIPDHSSDTVSRVDSRGERDYVSPSAERLLGVDLWSDVDAGDSGLIFKRGWVQAVAKPFRRPLLNAFTGYVSTWRDITDLKQTELRLSESEARFRAVADNASDVIICLDLDLRRTYVSPSSLCVLGYEPEEMVGFVPGTNICHHDLATTNACFKRLRSGESEREDTTCRLRHKSGRFVWVEGRLSLIRDPISADPAYILCSLRDVSSQKAQVENLLAANVGLELLSSHLSKARDASEQANNAKSRFLANVSHELRTPLNGILGYTQLLQLEGGLNTKQSERVKSMLSAGQHLLDMINSVLNISEIEAGRFEIHSQTVSLGETINACLDLLKPAAESKSLTLSRNSEADSPDKIVLDPMRLRQILLNLLGNAVKYTSHGGVIVRAQQVGCSSLRLEVVDSGPGIAHGDYGRLFQDFERLSVDAECAVEGAGVGLALSRRLVVAMGGTIGYEPNPKGGSIFWFELPMQSDSCDEHIGGNEAVQSKSEFAPRSLKILVVDDVAVNCDVTVSFLQTAGHQGVCARSGEDAVALAASMNIDLILMDVRMPGIGGLEATRRIRASASPSSQVPIVALTAQAFAEEITACLAAGMDAHLTKPFTRADLLTIIETAQSARLMRRNGASETPANILSTRDDEPPMFDPVAFQQTLEALSPAKTGLHLRSLFARTEALMVSLEASIGVIRSAEDVDKLVDNAHLLAGSAGVFGFMHLAMMARNYEWTALHEPDHSPRVAVALIEAAKRSLPEMDRCVARLALVIKASNEQRQLEPG